jgi:hypothetical protein
LPRGFPGFSRVTLGVTSGVTCIPRWKLRFPDNAFESFGPLRVPAPHEPGWNNRFNLPTLFLDDWPLHVGSRSGSDGSSAPLRACSSGLLQPAQTIHRGLRPVTRDGRSAQSKQSRAPDCAISRTSFNPQTRLITASLWPGLSCFRPGRCGISTWIRQLLLSLGGRLAAVCLWGNGKLSPSLWHLKEPELDIHESSQESM